MCGIAGVLAGPDAPPVTLEELRRMIAMLGHRGPDGHGLYRDRRIGLAHARLSLVDLEGGFQPLRNTDGSIWMSFNGEIFNYLELRRELAALGHRFYTKGDGEVIIHCYQRWGERAWAMLNGQFAFALWDARKRLLWLVRDRLGIVPLHLARVDGHLVFASEAKALFAGGRIAPRFDPQGLGEVFSCWSAAAPRTVFAGLRQLRPATALCIDHTLRETETRYWQPGGEVAALGAGEAADRLEHHLSQAVALRLRADVPVGCYLSGGLDSAVIASLANQQAEGNLHTFGIAFADPRFDEGAAQAEVAAHLGTRHHRTLCDGAAIRDALDQVVWHCETPLLRTAPVPLFLLSRFVAAEGIRTVLTGEGADELLAGYTLFKEDAIRRFWARRPDSAMRPALFDRIHHYVGPGTARVGAVWRAFFGRELAETGHPFYSHLVRWRNTAWTLRLLAPGAGAGFDLDAMMAAAAPEMPEGWRDLDPLRRAQLIEMRSFLSSYLLSCQGDRVAMAHGVEARYPFLDPQLVDFCLALPRDQKVLALRDKLALRRLAARRLPPAVWQRRKQPFRAPIGPALVGLLDEQDVDGELLDIGAAGRLIAKARAQGGALAEREEMGLVGMLTLSMLSRHFGAGFAATATAARAALAGSPLHVLEDHAAASVT